MALAHKAQEKRHDSVCHLVCSRDIDMEEPEAQLLSYRGLDSSHIGASSDAEQELCGRELPLSGSWEVLDGREDHH